MDNASLKPDTCIVFFKRFFSNLDNATFLPAGLSFPKKEIVSTFASGFFGIGVLSFASGFVCTAAPALLLKSLSFLKGSCFNGFAFTGVCITISSYTAALPNDKLDSERSTRFSNRNGFLIFGVLSKNFPGVYVFRPTGSIARNDFFPRIFCIDTSYLFITLRACSLFALKYTSVYPFVVFPVSTPILGVFSYSTIPGFEISNGFWLFILVFIRIS